MTYRSTIPHTGTFKMFLTKPGYDPSQPAELVRPARAAVRRGQGPRADGRRVPDRDEAAVGPDRAPCAVHDLAELQYGGHVLLVLGRGVPGRRRASTRRRRAVPADSGSARRQPSADRLSRGSAQDGRAARPAEQPAPAADVGSGDGVRRLRRRHGRRAPWPAPPAASATGGTGPPHLLAGGAAAAAARPGSPPSAPAAAPAVNTGRPAVH